MIILQNSKCPKCYVTMESECKKAGKGLIVNFFANQSSKNKDELFLRTLYTHGSGIVGAGINGGIVGIVGLTNRHWRYEGCQKQRPDE